MVSWRVGGGTWAILALGACNAISGAADFRVETQHASTGNDDPNNTGNDLGKTVPSDTDRNRDYDGGPAIESDASFDAGTVSFTDGFERADGTDIGNGWIEKVEAFKIVGGGVSQFVPGNDDFFNFLITRAEPAQNVQLSVEFTYNTTTESDPSLYARVAQSSATTADQLICYSMYVFRDGFGIDRNDGPMRDDTNWGVQMTGADLNPQLEANKTYRLVFKVTGTDPVQLDGAIIDVAAGTTVKTIGTSDNTPKKITSAGLVGFGGGWTTNEKFDNFVRTDL